MAIINIKEDTTAQTGTKAIDELSFTGTHSRSFTVLFDGADDRILEPILALDAYDLPALWDSHPGDPWMYVVNKTVEFFGANTWKVLVQYSRTEEPLSAAAQISWTFEATNEPIDHDVHGNAIVNSAHEPFDPPITTEARDLVLRIERNEASFDGWLAAEYIGAVNSDTFRGSFEPGTCKLSAWSATKTREAGLTYWAVSYEIRIRWDGWKRRLVDQGFRTLTGSTDGVPTYEVVTEPDSSGNLIPVTEPVQLNGSGGKLATNADPVFLEYEDFYTLPFAPLGLEDV